MSLFRVQEHILQASHIREYTRALADEQDDDLKIVAKQYSPLDNLSPKDGDLTIIAAHANGFPKELYEPLWDELHGTLKARNVRIRNILIADVAHQGASGILNEKKLGNDPSWLDHPRDLFLLVNHFRYEIKQPIIGLGHSMGGNNLVNLSLMHPRLFTTLILVDPVIQLKASKQGNFGIARASAGRRERWPNRKVAEASFKRSKFYQTWDPRVLDLWIKYGLRDVPTYTQPPLPTTTETSKQSVVPPVAIGVDASSTVPSDGPEVTLVTTRDQEVFTFLRPGPPDSSGVDAYPQPGFPMHITHPDFDPNGGSQSPFYRPEVISTFRRLPSLRPSVLYIFGEYSDLSTQPYQDEKLASTGVGPGGSGGVKAGRVKGVTLKKVGHLIPMEAVRATTEECTAWIIPELERWTAETEVVRREWEKIPRGERGLLGKDYVHAITTFIDGPPLGKRDKKANL